MKRSRINKIMDGAEKFIMDYGFHLPPFAQWSPTEWQKKGHEARRIIDNSLGWDVTDFGSSEFEKKGLFLFTMRNGKVGKTGDIPYAEKIMVVEVGQETPMHFHWSKTEDIINRGGGQLMMQIYSSTIDEKLDDIHSFEVVVNGMVERLTAGIILTINPGESISLTPRLYHRFWGEGSRVLVGEVSSVNDDEKDNRFYSPVGRFPKIEEDEEPIHLLIGDYAHLFRTS